MKKLLFGILVLFYSCSTPRTSNYGGWLNNGDSVPFTQPYGITISGDIAEGPPPKNHGRMFPPDHTPIPLSHLDTIQKGVNISIGMKALLSLTTGTNSIALGSTALGRTTPLPEPNTVGNDTLWIGDSWCDGCEVVSGRNFKHLVRKLRKQSKSQ